MKTIKELLEVYKPKAKDEQDFVDKHVVIKHKDRNGNDDDVFKGNTKYNKRKEERHGYDVGEDEKVYEEVEDIEEMSYAAASKRAEASRQRAIKRAAAAYKNHGDMDRAINDHDLFARDAAKIKAHLGEEVEEFDEEFEALEEAVELLDEGKVGYKHYTITSGPKMSGMGEGQPDHVEGSAKKLKNLDIEHKQGDDYGTTRRVTVTNNQTGESTHHHVYQREWGHNQSKPLISVRHLGKPKAAHDAHHNVLKHYLSGKTKIKEDVDLAFFEDLLEMNLDEDTFTDASLANLRVMKHKQMMKDTEKSSKIHPLMKVRKLSDARKKLAELEKARDHYVAKHEKAQSKKKKVAEEVEQIDELKKGDWVVHSGGKVGQVHGVSGDKASVDVKWNKTGRVTSHEPSSLQKMKEEVELDEKKLTPAEMKKREEIAKAMERENPGMPMAKKMAIATAQAKKVAEEVEDLDEGLMHDRYLRSHGKKARGTGSWAFTTKQFGSPKENEMHFTSGQKSLSDAHKEATAKLGTKHLYVMEEVEELDELSKSTLGSYAKKAMKDAPEKDRMGKAFSDMAADDAKRGEREGASYYGKRAAQSYTKAANRRAGVEKAIDKLTKEEYEDLDESAKVADHLIKRYGDNVRKSHVRSAANDFGVGYVALSHAVRKKLGVNRLEEEQIDELSKDTLARYAGRAMNDVRNANQAKIRWQQKDGAKDYHLQNPKTGSYEKRTAKEMEDEHSRVARNREKGVRTAIKKLAKEDIINRAIEKYMPEDYTPPSLKERFLNKIVDLPEAHAVTLLALFDSLNEQNQMTMIESVETEEGVNALLDFAINNRGE